MDVEYNSINRKTAILEIEFHDNSQLGRFSTPLTGQNCKSLVRGICTKFSITNLLLGHRVLGQH